MKAVENLSGVAHNLILQAKLQQQFVKYTAPGSVEHNPVILAATALDVRHTVLLNSVQVDNARTTLM